MSKLNADADRPDLSHTALMILVATGAVAIGVYFALLQPRLPEAWRTPGSPELYLVGVAGAALLMVSMVFVIVKRAGFGGSPPLWFVAHVVAGTMGMVLVCVHSAGYSRRPPALLFLLIAAIVFLGLWGRIRLSRRMAGTFASKHHSFAVASAEERAQFAPVIAAKRKLLAELSPEAIEGTFSLTLGHWLRSPRMSARYARLVREEERLMGTRSAVGMQQAHWRALHIVLGLALVLGLVVHVITVTFFAGYVADGGPITWWHITKW